MMRVSVEKVAIGTEYTCFALNSCNWLRLCIFQLKQLQLAQAMPIAVEVDTIGSDYACFN